MKLTNIRPIGRFSNKETGQSVNIKKGQRVDRGDDFYFYTLRGARVFVPVSELYSGAWEKLN